MQREVALAKRGEDWSWSWVLDQEEERGRNWRKVREEKRAEMRGRIEKKM